MAKNLREVFAQEKAGEQKIGAVEAVKEGLQTVAQRLSLREIFGEIKNELAEQVKHGSHELASALFTGNGYVQYARKESRDDPEHGLPQQQQERSYGGRELEG